MPAIVRYNAYSQEYASIPYSVAGTLSTGSGSPRLYFGQDVTIRRIHASVGTAPVGASVIVDVNKNGTTIFTTQANRPTIAVSTYYDISNQPDVTSLSSTDYLTIDIDQVGSTTAGANLVVLIDYTISSKTYG